ncbi:hypothetical protein BCV70DRAFT_198113 [Testicularia cyperi]|uniref:Uncharacterized protein n=1 Tax=Testicularia cyperi TaxID=1882483 RepID=A0A317XX10_9BASI|nr:hypothetical protein BCV70DRAFT_198113 [Testicularia cyperi]
MQLHTAGARPLLKDNKIYSIGLFQTSRVQVLYSVACFRKGTRSISYSTGLSNTAWRDSHGRYVEMMGSVSRSTESSASREGGVKRQEPTASLSQARKTCGGIAAAHLQQSASNSMTEGDRDLNLLTATKGCAGLDRASWPCLDLAFTYSTVQHSTVQYSPRLALTYAASLFALVIPG